MLLMFAERKQLIIESALGSLICGKKEGEEEGEEEDCRKGRKVGSKEEKPKLRIIENMIRKEQTWSDKLINYSNPKK